MKIMAAIPFFWVLVLSGCHVANDEISNPEDLLYNKVLHAIRIQNQNIITDSEYDQVVGYISKGGSKWVALYPKLKSTPFYGETSFQEGLNISMAYSLSHNPSETLQFVDKDNIGSICGIPFIEPTNNEIYTYYLKTRTAIASKAAESPWAEKCLLQLEKSMESMNSLSE
ncbi:hypothetical protein ACMV8I_05785 [Ewingella sp. S1.OA.A_B6]